MNPNPDIYGAPETWQNNYMFGGLTSNVATVLHAVRPKCATWSNSADYSSSQLRSGITAEKITQNQPIDKSIVPVGQGRGSAFKSIAVYHLDSDNHLILDNIARPNQGGAVNGVFGDFSSRGNYGVAGNNSCSRGLLDWNKKRARVWSPGSANIEGNDRNGNYYISPFVYYETRSILLQIEVAVCNSETVPDDPTAVPASTWRSLEDWKTLFPTYKIVGIRIKGLSLNAYSASTGDMTYVYTTYDSSTSTGYSHSLVWSPLDGIEIADNGEYYLYALFNSSATSGLVTMGYNTTPLYKWEGQSQYYVLMPFYDEFEDYIKYYTDDNVGGRIWYQIPYSDDIYETIMEACACFGCPFTPTATRVFNQAFTHTDLCLPIINDDGIANGEYTRGTDNLENDFIDLKTPWDKNYNPSAHVDPNTYSNTTNFNSVTTNAALSKYYVLDKTNVEKLGDDLWTICDTLSQNDYENFDGKIKDEFLTTNPIDSIISLVRYPFNIPHTFNNTKTAVQLGKSTGTAQGYRTYNVTFSVNFAGVDIFPRFENSFLDYSPYTKYELYVPFCGTIEINPGDILGHRLNLSLYVDLLTGSCIAYIFADSLVIGTTKGSCGLDQVLSGTQSATVNANIINGIITYNSIEESRMNQFGKMVYPTGIVKDVLDPFGRKETLNQLNLQHDKATFDLQHIATPTHKMGSPSPLLSWIQEFNARLMIYYPEGDVIQSAIPPSLKPAAVAAYGHVKGFATATPGIVNNFRLSGKAAFLSGEIVADSIPCTQNERARIKSFFAAGVYLPPIS